MTALESDNKQIQTEMCHYLQNWAKQREFERNESTELKLQIYQQQKVIMNIQTELKQEQQEHNKLVNCCAPVLDYITKCKELEKIKNGE